MNSPGDGRLATSAGCHPSIQGHQVMGKLFPSLAKISLPGAPSGPGHLPFCTKHERGPQAPGPPLAFPQPKKPGFYTVPQAVPLRPRAACPAPGSPSPDVLSGLDTYPVGFPCTYQMTDRQNLLEVTEKWLPEVTGASGNLWKVGVPPSTSVPFIPKRLSPCLCNASSRLRVRQDS